MDIGMERNEGGAATIGTLFQHIVNEMKNTGPLWEDLIAKATKLHACLRAAIQALAAYLEAFQKIADAATNSKGATKEIGTALTRVCLRHKAVETRMKTFTAAMMDYLIVPLQDKLEDWKKQVVIIDKDHAKEYKRCRAELKKRSSDTLRLQKKARKGQADNLHILVESSMQDVTLRRCELEEVERKSLRTIMVEERSRYCTFVNMLQPVVHEECEVMSELSHLQEAMQLIAVVTKDPSILPQASEELILESKTNINLYPDSPGGSNSQGGCSNSLGSRKSSVCSISSMNSSSSGSPGHQFQRSLSQYSPAIRLKPGESSDSGFCSSPALTSQASTLASQSHAVSTWPPHTQDGAVNVDRPHTISSAYEKGHQRPALTVYTFQNPEVISENQKSPANVSCRPPLPVRCSSLERPLSTSSMKNANANIPRQCPSPIPAHITKVLEKTSMFEQQINNNQHPQQGPLNTPTRNENIYGRKNDDISKTSSLIVDKDADRIDNETIEELNNLIGELDLFQKEHELRLEEHYQSTNSPNENGLEHTSNGLHFSSNNSDSSISDRHDRTSISSSMNIEGFNTSLNSTNLGHEYSLGYSDNNINMYSGIDQQTSDSDTGFENPSFIHLNDAEIVVKRQNNFENVDPENYYSQNMSEIVVLRSKDTKSDATRIDENPSTDGQQRLSSFKLNSRSASPALSSFTISKSPTHSITSLIPTSSSVSSQLNVASSKTNDNNNHIMKLQQQQQPSPLYASTNGNGKFSLISMPSDEHINNRIKPAITPRPASLSGAARVTRRSSINTVKPPPPVRRSSSVTPNPNTGANSPNLTQQSLGYTSSESLPPPPAYLLDSTAGNSPIPGNVAGTVKALNEIRHKPASPSVLRRASQNFPAQQQSPLNFNYFGFFCFSSIGNARIKQHHTSNAYSSTPKHETSSKPASPYTPQSPPNSFHSSGDSPNMPSNRSSKPSHHQHGIYAQPKQLSTMSSFRTSSPAPQKQSTGFLAQLNARIAPNKAQQQLTSQNYEGVYHRNNPADQRSFYSSSSSSNQQSQSQQGIYSSTQQSSTQQQQQQQQQQQAQSHYNHHQQQQAVAPTNQRDGKTQIYPTSHSQSQLQQQHHHYQQQQQQLKYQQQQQSTSQHYYQPQQQYATQNIYVSTNPFVTSVSPVHSVSSYSPSSFGKSPRESNSASGSVGGGPSSSSHDNSSHDGVHCRSSHQSRNSGSVGSANMSTHKVLTKTSTGFLENLNARLAEQRLSGKAFAVRNLINSKALPDPRICHESLMDQIKRGATLKRNRTVNDRSAPKIH
ncbi:probable serine/threonine-protein kinase DDB_G0267686 isoform X12 [Toxorhynchites rutilus septentrionalis]|uniref:probable serine/threonine-protein kinase DDB_G0267686 isoform X12 n=1 Tax=Toxorhynchites rutilus septentrionalis TaxID=329112 RepID=UPI00247A33BB|nr:probable serine/threonine-protein kinase DDB_G0267686 isoform X12 [Toxorhynchites rutilus septentrionalis]